ncbi:MAG: MlaD family protein [Burkholderiaceae bacterium]|nr:MlaD family protein [Burkholderiaceae bacterium]
MQTPPSTPPLKNVEFKALSLLILLLGLVIASVMYLMYARGVFERTQTLFLMADDSEGITVGSDLSFSGFPIGRVRRIELAENGRAKIMIEVAKKDARWLRTSSIFTMERGLVGETRLRAFTGILTDPPLPEGSVREVLRGDATAELPRLLSTMRTLADNLERLTRSDSSLSQSLDNVQSLTGQIKDSLKGRYGALGIALGSEENAQKVIHILDRTHSLLAKAEASIFGPRGLMKDTQTTVQELNTILSEARLSLKKVDAILIDAQAIASNTRVATTDLGALRAEVEASLRKVELLVDEVNRKWPFRRESELKLP